MVSASAFIKQTSARIVAAAGGPARLQIILVLGGVLGVSTADMGTVSAVSDQLKQAFKIGNTQLGLLLAVVSFIGAVATLPMGVLADRVPRRQVLMAAITGWAAAMAVGGFATSYLFLLLTRLGLGAVVAAAWPCIASLSGDFFPARDRAAVFGMILSGELVGAGIGFFISGEVSSIANWRWSFFVMAAPALVLVWVIWRYLPEPARGAQAWLKPGEREPSAATRPRAASPEQEADQAIEPEVVEQATEEYNVQPRQELVLHEDPTRRSWWWAMAYLLRIPSYRLLIAASGLAYYFFAGIRTFAMIYFTGHYGLSRGAVSALVIVIGGGAVAGLLAGGHLSRRLLDNGYLNARIVVPAIALFLSVPLFGGGLWTVNAWLGILLLTLGTAALSAAVAPIDAARLDIIHPLLWGRGESGRMALRSAFEGGAPLLFGAVTGWLGGGDSGLRWTFIVMLAPMLAAGSLVLPGRHSYPRDVVTAAASVEATAGKK